ncbi:MAG: hypothetical protein GXP42_12055 [Chloroflexi bacterium]|nr:hypothetical protein [Chloroflexota bacterium]
MTEGDKLFLINLFGTYLPTEDTPELGGEVMRMSLKVEKMWLDEAMEKTRKEAWQEAWQKGVQEGDASANA